MATIRTIQDYGYPEPLLEDHLILVLMVDGSSGGKRKLDRGFYHPQITIVHNKELEVSWWLSQVSMVMV